MASISIHRASSTSNPRSYDVFLNFRGSDTRKNFTDHLYNTLVSHRIHTFRDDEELEKGGDIAVDLPKAIEESRIFIIIFSKNYANSRWCLNELLKIFECTTRKESMVLPIFYHVPPTDVGNQLGSFGDAFAFHEKGADQKKKEMVQKWRIALEKAANLSGWHVENQYESEIIGQIIEKILRKLGPAQLYVGKNIVGMDYHLEQLKALINMELNDIRIIGIYGIGGIGKTTIAKAIYNEISCKFEASSILFDVRQRSKDNVGLLELQNKLLDDTLVGTYKKKSRDIHEAVHEIRDKLRLKRVLVILDDVDKREQLDYLAAECEWFGSGSRIIITTRHKGLIAIDGANISYEPRKLNDEEAIKLFSLYAFKQNVPREDYKKLCDTAVKYAQGLPLALTVLGSTLSSKRGIREWESELRKLEKEPNMEIYNVLRISFDGLSRLEREIFLDIACFFKGKDRDFVSRILDDADGEISNLCERCLISILDNKIYMHDLIQQMGWEIVREKFQNEPGKQTRLWDLDDVSSVLARNAGTKAVEGLFIDMSAQEEIQFTAESFAKMNKLRLLKVHQDAKYDHIMEIDQDVHLPQVALPEDFKLPSFELRYLHWDEYSLKYLPANFHPKNLVELNLQCSNIKQLWKGNKLLKKLKVINLNHSQHLMEFPSFSMMPNLEILTLEGCISLESLPMDIDKLQQLQTLSCHGCSKLEHFPEIICAMKNLKKLDLYGTTIEKLPSSIEHLEGLEYLNLAYCENLLILPESICNLRFLKFLNVDACSKLHKLMESLESLQCLEELHLGWLNCELPTLSGLSSLRVLHLNGSCITPRVIRSDKFLSLLEELTLSNCNVMETGVLDHIFHLSSLKELDLSNCHLMEGGIPNDIYHLSSLQALDLSGTGINCMPASISRLSKLKFLGLSHCKQLQGSLELPSSVRFLDAHDCFKSLSWQRWLWGFLFNCFKSEIQDVECRGDWHDIQFGQSGFFGKGISIVIPGMPNWIRYQKLGNEIRVELPINWYEDNGFLGFALCAVYAPLKNMFGDAPAMSYGLGCHLSLCGDEFGFRDYLSFYSVCKCYGGGESSDQVWMTYYPQIAIQEKYRSNKWRQFTALFVCYGTGSFKVIKCGVTLIYERKRKPLGSVENVSVTCSKCQKNEELQEKLCLGGTAISELSIIGGLSTIENLCLRNCKRLESLPSDIYKLKSLTTLSCSGCLKLQSFPEIMEDMKNLRELRLDGTALKELPSSIQHLQGLQYLDLENCKNLVNIPDSICNLRSLKTLIVSGCSKLNKIPENLGSLTHLQLLCVARLDSMSCQLPSLLDLRFLRILNLDRSNLVHGAIRSDISILYSLEEVDLSYCNLAEGGIPSEICYLSSLQALYLKGNHFSSIPSGISQLSKLKILDLSHCEMLRQIPELPSSLRVLDAHGCIGLESLSGPQSLLLSSLFKCFKSEIQELEYRMVLSSLFLQGFAYHGVNIVIPESSGILEGRLQEGSQATMELPWNWYENNNFLGFALCSAYSPLDNESEDGDGDGYSCTFKCLLTFWNDTFRWQCELPLKSSCACYNDVGVSDQVWVMYYPKGAIKKNIVALKHGHLSAAFHGYIHGRPVKVKKCAVHFLYNQESSVEDTDVIKRGSNYATLISSVDRALKLFPNSPQFESLSGDVFRAVNFSSAS